MQHKLCISLTFLLMVGGAIDLSQATMIQEARLQYHTGKLSLASETLELAIITARHSILNLTIIKHPLRQSTSIRIPIRFWTKKCR